MNMFLLEVERIEAQLKEVEGKYHIADEESKGSQPVLREYQE